MQKTWRPCFIPEVWWILMVSIPAGGPAVYCPHDFLTWFTKILRKGLLRKLLSNGFLPKELNKQLFPKNRNGWRSVCGWRDDLKIVNLVSPEFSVVGLTSENKRLSLAMWRCNAVHRIRTGTWTIRSLEAQDTSPRSASLTISPCTPWGRVEV